MKHIIGLFACLCLLPTGMLFAEDTVQTDLSQPSSESPWKLELEVAITWQGQSYSTIWDGVSPSPNGIETNPLFFQYGANALYSTAQNEYFKFGLDLFFDDYVYRNDLQRAFPTQIETGSATGPVATVMALVPKAAYVWDIPLTKDARLGISAGLALLFRIPIIAIDNSSNIDSIGTYLNRNLKFVYPEIGISAIFPLSTGLEFGPYLRTLIPLHNLWNGENLPFWDNWQIDLGISIQIKL